jgi:hypothetical protein
MLNIFLIDTFKADKNHGLNTYIDQLGQGLACHQLNLTYLWLNAPFQKIEPYNIYFPKLAGNSSYEYMLQNPIYTCYLMRITKLGHSPSFPFAYRGVNC